MYVGSDHPTANDPSKLTAGKSYLYYFTTYFFRYSYYLKPFDSSFLWGGIYSLCTMECYQYGYVSLYAVPVSAKCRPQTEFKMQTDKKNCFIFLVRDVVRFDFISYLLSRNNLTMPSPMKILILGSVLKALYLATYSLNEATKINPYIRKLY